MQDDAREFEPQSLSFASSVRLERQRRDWCSTCVAEKVSALFVMGSGERAQIPAAQSVIVSHPLWPVAIYLSELGTCTYPRCIGGVYVGQGLRMRMLMGSRRTTGGTTGSAKQVSYVLTRHM